VQVIEKGKKPSKGQNSCTDDTAWALMH